MRRSLCIQLIRVAALSVALLLVGCSGGDSKPTATVSASSTPPAATVAPSASASTPAAKVDVLAALKKAGVPVVPIGTPDHVSGGPIEVTDWQADAWSRELAAKGGLTGRALRTSFPMPATSVPIDYLVATWLLKGTRPASAVARTLVDASKLTRPDDFAYPTAVLAIFANDVMNQNGTTTISFVPGAQSLAVGAGANSFALDPCGAIQSLYNQTIGAIAQWTQTTASDGYLLSLAKGAVGLFGSLLGGAITAITNPIVGPIKTALAALSIAVGIAEAVSPWEPSFDATPDSNDAAVEPAPGNPGTVKLSLSVPLGAAWPAALQSCADLAKISLPDINPVGTKVNWTLSSNGLVKAGDGQTAEGALAGSPTSPTASYNYVTIVETKDRAEHGKPTSGEFMLSADVLRDSKQKLTPLIKYLFATALPIIPSSVVTEIVGGTDPIGKLDTLISSPASTSVVIRYHAPTPTPSATPPKVQATQTSPSPGATPAKGPATFTGSYTGHIEAQICGGNGTTVQFVFDGDSNVYLGLVTTDSRTTTSFVGGKNEDLWKVSGGMVKSVGSSNDFDVTGVSMSDEKTHETIVLTGIVSCH